HLNAEGKMVGLKSINKTTATICSSNNAVVRYKESDITQSDKNLMVAEWQTEQSTINKDLFFVELIDSNTPGEAFSPKKLALGDGASKTTHFGNEDAQGWNGDTLAINA